MNAQALRTELYSFYLHGDAERARAFAARCFAILDARVTDMMSAQAQKCLQYDVICEEFEPILFPHCPFFFETAALTSLSDGARSAKGHGFTQANGWTFARNEHLFRDGEREALYQKRRTQSKALLYLICGYYNDDSQHFNFNCRPILKGGLKSVYNSAKAELARANTPAESEFLEAVCHGMLTLRRMAEKFAHKAEELLPTADDETAHTNLTLIASAARRVPWEAPTTLYEALATLAFLRTALGTLEGVGPNTFGRLDKDLISFLRADLDAGRLTMNEAYELVCQFLLIWDCHYDHDMKMAGYADHELENTYTLGGCDDNGKPLYNEMTSLFLRATRNEGIIFPKIKCRFSKNSPKEYLDEINASIVAGTSTVLLQNDDATIPALLRSGKTLAEARDYCVTGCWGVATAQEKYDHGNYLNLLKPFEFALHRLDEAMERVGIQFEYLDGCESFEELYRRVLTNTERLLDARIEITRQGGAVLPQVDPCAIFSSTLENCLEKHADYAAGGAKYRDDYYLLFGLPNLVDSLMAIKTLVFDSHRYTLQEFLSAVRESWEGHEEMRQAAISCHGWGDGNTDSCDMANRLNEDLFALCASKVGGYGGRVHMGHLTYTEIRFWGEQTLATPDGRRNGDYFAQGLTPSRLKRIPCVNDVIRSFLSLDASTMAANSVVNVILPPAISLDRCEGFLRAVATTAVQSLQLNCTSREQLLDAQKHPEKYPDLIVRVTGFSAKFTALSKEWQDEVISRNFYE